MVTSGDSLIGGYMGVHYDETTQTETTQWFAGTGAAHVTGGAAWHTGSLIAGVDGAGTLEVAGGGHVDSHLGGAGLGSDSTGTVTVTGPDSAWMMAPRNAEAGPGERGELIAGGWGQGQVTVADGGRIDCDHAVHRRVRCRYHPSGADWGLGTPAGTGTVTVTGVQGETPSQLNVTGSGPLYVGYSGTGTLNVAAGGQVTSGNSLIGYRANSTGTAAVSGDRLAMADGRASAWAPQAPAR